MTMRCTNSEWAELLADHFFACEFAGEPVTFAVDPDALAVIAGKPWEEAIESLAHAVRVIVMPGYHFDRVRDLARRWRREGCDGPPPSLPLLALTVLAVSMNEQFGLYKPLRRLLDPQDDEGGMPGDFDAAVPELWEQLKWWLEDHEAGRRGLPTITKHDFYVNIGYSTQQALLRASDRPLVYRFFRSIGLVPGEEQLVASELRRALAIWSKQRLPRAERLHRLATDPSLTKYADALLETLAARWDGRLRDNRTGSRASVLRIMLEFRPLTLSFVALRRSGDPEEVEIDLAGAGRTLLRSAGGHYEPLPLPLQVTSDGLRDGVDLSGHALSFFHERGKVIAFAYHDDLREWLSADRIRFDEKHHLVVHADVRSETVRWFEQEGFDGRLDPNASRHLPTGWFLVRDVRINRRPDRRAPTDIQDILGGTGGGERLRLVGGLKIRALARTYLTGGIPNVALPRTLADPVFEIQKDGFRPIQREAEGHEFEMAKFDLPPGDYRVVHHGASFPLAVVRAFREVAPPDVASIRTGGGVGAASGLVANPPIAVDPPVVVPALADDAMVVLGPAPGDKATVSVPLWLEHVSRGPLSWSTLDAWVGFAPVWLLTSTGSRDPAYIAHPRRPIPPMTNQNDPQWARLIRMSTLTDDAEPNDVERWKEYVTRAKEMEV